MNILSEYCHCCYGLKLWISKIYCSLSSMNKENNAHNNSEEDMLSYEMRHRKRHRRRNHYNIIIREPKECIQHKSNPYDVLTYIDNHNNIRDLKSLNAHNTNSFGYYPDPIVEEEELHNNYVQQHNQLLSQVLVEFMRAHHEYELRMQYKNIFNQVLCEYMEKKDLILNNEYVII